MASTQVPTAVSNVDIDVATYRLLFLRKKGKGCELQLQAFNNIVTNKDAELAELKAMLEAQKDETFKWQKKAQIKQNVELPLSSTTLSKTTILPTVSEFLGEDAQNAVDDTHTSAHPLMSPSHDTATTSPELKLIPPQSGYHKQQTQMTSSEQPGQASAQSQDIGDAGPASHQQPAIAISENTAVAQLERRLADIKAEMNKFMNNFGNSVTAIENDLVDVKLAVSVQQTSVPVDPAVGIEEVPVEKDVEPASEHSDLVKALDLYVPSLDNTVSGAPVGAGTEGVAAQAAINDRNSVEAALSRLSNGCGTVSEGPANDDRTVMETVEASQLPTEEERSLESSVLTEGSNNPQGPPPVFNRIDQSFRTSELIMMELEVDNDRRPNWKAWGAACGGKRKAKSDIDDCPSPKRQSPSRSPEPFNSSSPMNCQEPAAEDFASPARVEGDAALNFQYGTRSDRSMESETRSDSAEFDGSSEADSKDSQNESSTGCPTPGSQTSVSQSIEVKLEPEEFQGFTSINREPTVSQKRKAVDDTDYEPAPKRRSPSPPVDLRTLRRVLLTGKRSEIRGSKAANHFQALLDDKGQIPPPQNQPQPPVPNSPHSNYELFEVQRFGAGATQVAPNMCTHSHHEGSPELTTANAIAEPVEESPDDDILAGLPDETSYQPYEYNPEISSSSKLERLFNENDVSGEEASDGDLVDYLPDEETSNPPEEKGKVRFLSNDHLENIFKSGIIPMIPNVQIYMNTNSPEVRAMVRRHFSYPDVYREIRTLYHNREPPVVTDDCIYVYDDRLDVIDKESYTEQDGSLTNYN